MKCPNKAGKVSQMQSIFNADITRNTCQIKEHHKSLNSVRTFQLEKFIFKIALKPNVSLHTLNAFSKKRKGFVTPMSEIFEPTENK